MNVLIFLGSIRQPSLTRVLAERAADALDKFGIGVDWVDPLKRPLPIANPAFHHNVEATPDDAVRDLVDQVAAADGIILASPLYHGSYSGVLKNALDCLAFDMFRDKPVGLLAHGSGAKRCAQPAEHLLPVIRTVYGHALQCQVASSKADFAIDEETGTATLIDEDVAMRCDRLAEEMYDFLSLRQAAQ